MKRQNGDTDTTLEVLRGRDGRDGRDGLTGPMGITGPPGPKGDTGPAGKNGSSGLDGIAGLPGLKGDIGPAGQDGLSGLNGTIGPPGPKGDTGAAGPKGEGVGGVVYVRWGHNSCPSTGAQQVYSGRAGGSDYATKGGGSNPQCLPLDPNYLTTVSGTLGAATIHGAEYERTDVLVANSQDTDVVCAVCYVPTRNVVYMLPAKYTCPTGWTREYYGYLMSARYNHYRSTFSCIDNSFTAAPNSSTDLNGYLFYPVEGVCGSLPCPPYDETSELTCAICTK